MNKVLDELVDQINESEKAGTYDLDSYRPDHERFYRLSEMTEDNKHLKVISGFMTFKEMESYLKGFLQGLEAHI